ncbi:MAG: glycosyltransferase family 1 protein [Patescibacteria group bacterium]
MRIGIDARFYGPKLGGGGLGRYVAELVTHLEQIDRSNEYVLFLRKENFHECRMTRPNFTKRLVDIPWYSFAEQRVLPQEIARAKVNFMHFPHWNVPILSRTPFLVTIHDLILLEDPTSAHATTRNALVHGIKYAAFRVVLENAIHRSRQIISVSEHTKQAILKHFRVKPQKITVIHNGVRPPSDGRGVSLRELGVLEPYVLAVGNRYPHKNLETLLEAFVDVVAQYPSASLVLAGRHDVFTERLMRLAKRLGLPEQALRWVNLPSDEQLGALYRHANLLAFPSKIEGFGIPPIEAMHVGTPVLASNASCLPEILGDAAMCVAPDDAEAMTKFMLQALERPADMQTYIAKGHERVKRFNWEAAAKATLETYLRHGPQRL